MVNKFDPLGERKLVFVNSVFPTSHPTTGAPVVHREQAAAFHQAGYDVVLIEGSNRFNDMVGKVPYRIHSILFDGRDPTNNPEYEKEPDRYEAVNPTVAFNLPVFLAAPSSSNRVVGLKDEEIGQYIMSWAWGIRSAILKYGVPEASWNSHTWIINRLTSAVPTLFTVHGTAISHEGGYRETRLHHFNQLGVDDAFFAAAISDQEFENITDQKRYGMDPAKVRVIKNGFNDDIFRPDLNVTKAELIEKHGDKLNDIDPDKPWVVFAGRAAHFKGIDNLISAMRKVNEETGAHLIILGSGDYRRVEAPDGTFLDLYALVERLSLKGRVHFVGAMKQPQMAEMISVADAYVLPSRKEPFGLVAIEGMGAGKVPILTANGGFLDIVNDRKDIARMVKPEDVDSADVLRKSLEHITRNGDLPVPLRMATIDILMAKMIGSTPKLSANYSNVVIAEAHKLSDRVRTLYARKIAISSLSDGIMAELSLPLEERRARGLVSAQYAKDNFSMKTVVKQEMVPWLELAIAEGKRANFALDYVSGSHPAKRQQRLDAISMDPDLAQAYQHLLQNVGTRQFGSAWRAFDTTVAHYFGHANLMYPYDVEALPDFANEPNAIFSEVARAAGVSTQEMYETMQKVEETPVSQLEKMPAPMVVGAAMAAGLHI